MSYTLRLTAPAKREVDALPGAIRTQFKQIGKSLEIEPRSHRAKELRGKPNIYRVWLAGKWRIVYSIDDELQLVLILRVRLKDEIDYNSI